MEERRSSPRVEGSGEINIAVTFYEYCEAKRVESKAKVLNESENGLCILTSLALEPGHVLVIDNREVGLVRWAKREDSHTIAGISKKGRIYGLSQGRKE